MGRNTAIYMFDKEKASTLYEDFLHPRNFKEYLKESETGFGEINFENLLETVRNDINQISAKELSVIISLLNRENHFYSIGKDHSTGEKKLQEMYNRLGITLLYEVPTSTVCYCYMFQYANYTYYFPVDQMTDEDIGLTIDSKDFLSFNDYMSLLTKRILDSRLDGFEYTFTEHEEKTVSEIKDHPDNRPILEEVENEFEYLKKMFNKDNIATQTVCRAYDFFLCSAAMKSKINADKNTRIVILDSC